MRIQILHYRDPDGGCTHDVFVNGLRHTARDDFTIEFGDVDPGRGWLREEWDERIADAEAAVQANPHSAYERAYLDLLRETAGNEFIRG